MQPNEAEKVVGDLIRRYPGRDMADSSVDVFIRTALGFTAEEGGRAVDRVARHSPMFLPSWAQWEQALLAESHERREEERAARSLPAPDEEPPLPREEVAKLMREGRERLAKIGHPEVELPQASEATKTRLTPRDFDPCVGKPLVERGGHLTCQHCGKCADPDCPPNRCRSVDSNQESQQPAIAEQKGA